MQTNDLTNEDQPEGEEKLGLLKTILYIFHLFRPYISIGFCAPFAAGAIFAYISLGYSGLPSILDLLVPILVGFFMGCGFFALDSYQDVETDKQNPRQKTLPHIFDKGLLPRWVGVVSAGILLGAGIIISIFVSLIHFILAILGASAAVLYTSPPFRFKGRAGLDLFINIFAFGLVGSIYGWLLYSDFAGLVSVFGWFVIPLCCILTFIIVFPTPMIDYEADKAAGDRSTVVRLGLKGYAKLGLISMIFISITMTLMEIKIYFDFLSVPYINFSLPILIGLLLVGVLTFISYYIIYHWPTPKTAFYMTGISCISVALGAFLALQIADFFPFT